MDRHLETPMNDPAPTSAAPAHLPRTRHWLLFVAGMLFFMLGPWLYVVQFRAKQLVTPWYMPLLASFGVVLMFYSVRRRRGWLRVGLLIFFAVLCGLEWFMIAVATRSPAYAGPAQPGRTLPQFTAKLATGSPFTQADLEQGKPTVLLFYRGHW